MSLTVQSEISTKVNGGVTKEIDDLLEVNIAHAPLTLRSIRTFYDALDTEKKGYVSLDILRQWYRSLDFLGTDPTDREIEFAVKEHQHTVPEGLTYDEFVLFILKISQW